MSLNLEGKLRAPVVDWLASRGMTPVFEVVLAHYCDVIGVQFGPRIGRQIPLMLQVCAIELKLHDCAGVLKQAKRNSYHVPFSWVAMPQKRVAKMQARTVRAFEADSIGLLSVTPTGVNVIVEASRHHPETNGFNTGDHLRQKLWRRRDEWVKRLSSPPSNSAMAAKAEGGAA